MGLLDELNPAQREAVSTTEGPVLVLAGAGSGKTRVLTYRIAHILEQGLATPDEILAVTFTNKAAGEVRDRVEKLCETRRRFPWLGTFHSICVRLLRARGEAIGITRGFTIYDSGDQLTCLKEAMKDLEISEDSFKPKRALSVISRAKNRLEDVEKFERAAVTDELKIVARIYRAYNKKLRENQALDFDDLLVRAVDLLKEQPEVLEEYQRLFRYILVDEYQDVNFAQYVLIRKLAAHHKNLCVVGDDDQSIYAFRGADVSIILQFEKDFPESRIVKLEQNYRSTRAVLDAANAVVRNNPHRREKTMWTANQQGQLPTVSELPDGRAEARYVANRIRHLARSGREYGDFAVLYRANSQSRLFEDALRHKAIPYELVGGTRFWDRKVVKDLVSYLRVVMNTRDDVSMRRIINVPPRSIGTIQLGRLLQSAERRECSLYQILSQTDEVGNLTAKALAAISEVRSLIEEVRNQVEQREPVRDMIDRIIRRTDYKAFVAPDQTVESQTNLDNVNELLTSAVEFERECEAQGEEATLENFLAQGALASDVDSLKGEGGAVTLMTLHGAKGLEYPVVFLAGMEEGTFPHARVLDNPKELEEERRLCYVGMTRAREVLFLTRAMRRDSFVQDLPQEREASQFLDEIPKECAEYLDVDPSLYEDDRPAFSRTTAASGFGQGSGASYTGGGKSTTGWRESALATSARSTPVAGRATTSRSTSASRSGPVVKTTGAAAARVVSSSSRGAVAARRVVEPRPPRVIEATFSAGQKVVHKVFGEGQVMKVEGRTVTADFPGYGEKTVVESFLTPSQGAGAS